MAFLLRGLRFVAVLIFLYTRSVSCQQGKPCTRQDGASSLDLQVRISEATQQEIDANPLAYRSLIGINGIIDSTLPQFRVSVLLIQNDASISPAEYFLMEDNFDGINVRLKKGLDRDGPTASSADDFVSVTYDLRCLPRDGGAEITYNLTIFLDDANDNPPVFVGAPFVFNVTENLPAGTLLGRVSAEDKDEAGNPNSQVTYYIDASSDPSASFFTINANSGDILSTATLDYEQQSVYTIYVGARDIGIRHSLTKVTITRVTINVVDVQDNLPVFSHVNYVASVPEDAPLNTAVMQVKATDADSTGHIEYLLVDDAAGTFLIDPRTGTIFTRRLLDREMTNFYKLVVSTKEGVSYAVPETSAKVLVLIQDINDNAPIFVVNSATVTISENTTAGASIYRLTAIDGDEGENARIQYGLVSAPGAKFFSVDSYTGEVRLNDSLCSTNASTITLWPEATDQGIPQLATRMELRVNIKRETHARSLAFQQDLYRVILRDSVPAGTVVVTVTAKAESSSKCSPKPIQYAITDSLSKDFFDIDGRTGVIKVIRTLFGLAFDKFIMTVEASNVGGARTTTTVQLTVIPNRHAPAFVDPLHHQVVVREDIQPGSIVDQVHAVDADTTARSNVVRYEAVGDSAAMEFFSVDPEHGLITVAKNLSAGDATTYYLFVKASDNGSPALSHSVTVTVAVQRNLHAPIFSNTNYVAGLAEDFIMGGTILTVTARDGDTHAPYNTVHYQATGDALATEFFKVDPVTGAIGLKKALTLDPSLTLRYQLTVEAKDGGGYSTKAKVTLNVSRHQTPSV